jgi:hypothetical protein
MSEEDKKAEPEAEVEAEAETEVEAPQAEPKKKVLAVGDSKYAPRHSK